MGGPDGTETTSPRPEFRRPFLVEAERAELNGLLRGEKASVSGVVLDSLKRKTGKDGQIAALTVSIMRGVFKGELDDGDIPVLTFEQTDFSAAYRANLRPIFIAYKAGWENSEIMSRTGLTLDDLNQLSHRLERKWGVENRWQAVAAIAKTKIQRDKNESK